MLTAEIVTLILRHGSDHIIHIVEAWQEAGSPSAEQLAAEFKQYQDEHFDYGRCLDRKERRRKDDYDL